jgi:hypothetical protein
MSSKGKIFFSCNKKLTYCLIAENLFVEVIKWIFLNTQLLNDQ